MITGYDHYTHTCDDEILQLLWPLNLEQWDTFNTLTTETNERIERSRCKPYASSIVPYVTATSKFKNVYLK